MSEAAIHVENLSKLYRLGAKQEAYRTLRDSITDLATAPFRRFRRKNTGPSGTFWALRNVNFQIDRGEVVGIVGRNGAGKSTLLKVLSRITEPTEGFADIEGRVGSLLEVGTGFHPELTGRENIYLNGAILGMKRFEIQARFDEIVAFAEVEQFLDTAVKHYSSGMYLRLAFAVAAHLEPEILLVDEVLAVGDAAFQRKCIGKMSDVARQGRTVLFVSHNMAAIRQLCTSAFMLSSGEVVNSGSAEDVIRTYLQSTLADTGSDLSAIRDRKGAGEARFSYIRFEDGGGAPVAGLVCGQPGRIVLGVRSNRPMRKVRACIGFLDTLNQRLMYLDSKFVGEELPELPSDGELVCEIPRVHLAPGRYRLEMWLQTASKEQDRLTDAGAVEVEDGNFFGTGRAVAQGFQVALMDFGWRAQVASGALAESKTA